MNQVQELRKTIVFYKKKLTKEKKYLKREALKARVKAAKECLFYLKYPTSKKL
jgi:hypothetical protein